MLLYIIFIVSFCAEHLSLNRSTQNTANNKTGARHLFSWPLNKTKRVKCGIRSGMRWHAEQHGGNNILWAAFMLAMHIVGHDSAMSYVNLCEKIAHK